MKTKFIIAICVLSTMFALSASAAVIIPPPSITPTNTADCKKGGWENHNGLFKNQGDCVSFVATDGKNQPDGPNAQ
jgi:hypothetical protein